VLVTCSIALVAELYLSGQMLKTPSRDPFADTADVDPQGRSLILVISGFSGARDFTLVLPDEKNSWLGVIPEAVASSHTMCGVICKALSQTLTIRSRSLRNSNAKARKLRAMP
jgi:hypothetical protein